MTQPTNPVPNAPKPARPVNPAQTQPGGVEDAQFNAGFSTSPYAQYSMHPTYPTYPAAPAAPSQVAQPLVPVVPAHEHGVGDESRDGARMGQSDSAGLQHVPVGVSREVARRRLAVAVTVGAVLAVTIVALVIVGWSSQWWLDVFDDPAKDSPIVVR